MRILAGIVLSLAAFWSMADADPALVDKTWYLTSINSVPIEVMNFPDRKPSLTLSSDNRYNAYAGCNQIMGSYELDPEDTEITFSKSAMTMMACEKNMDFEQQFVDMLQRVEFYSIEGEGQILNLKSIDLQIISVFDNTPQ